MYSGVRSSFPERFIITIITGCMDVDLRQTTLEMVAVVVKVMLVMVFVCQSNSLE